MVEGKTLSVFRDIVLIVGILIICFCEMQGLLARLQANREQAIRFAVSRNAVAQLDDAYKKAVVGKSINEQVFRQNEVLIEYQKLLLTVAYLPAGLATQAVNRATQGPGPALPPAQGQPQAPSGSAPQTTPEVPASRP